MSNNVQLKEHLDSFVCPNCQSSRLLPTKEKIIICQGCLTGYKMIGDVPDFRIEKSISFKKKIAEQKKGVNAVLTVMIGEDKNQSFDVKLGHCVVIGRKSTRITDESAEMTMVGRPEDFQQQAFASLDPTTHQLIERYLSRTSGQDNMRKDAVAQTKDRLLGSFVRDPDFTLGENSVSRSHAVVYQDETGVHLLDLVSKNGTYVNGCEIETSRLKDGDVVSLGTASLRVRFY